MHETWTWRILMKTDHYCFRKPIFIQNVSILGRALPFHIQYIILFIFFNYGTFIQLQYFEIRSVCVRWFIHVMCLFNWTYTFGAVWSSLTQSAFKSFTAYMIFTLLPVKNRKPHFPASIILRSQNIHHEVKVNNVTKTKVKEDKRDNNRSLNGIANTNDEDK